MIPIPKSLSWIPSLIRLTALLAALSSLSYAPELRAQAPKLRFTHLSNEQGLSNSTIESIFQDSRGFIWFGTRDGLNRYDGNEITVYRNDPADTTSLSDNYIRCIYEDRDHRLWVGTINGLNRLNQRKNSFTRFKHKDDDSPNSLSHNLITSLAEDKEGHLWVGTFGGGINLFDKRKETFRHFDAGLLHSAGINSKYLSDNRVNALFSDRAANLWIATSACLDLFNPSDSSFTHYRNDSSTTNPSGNTIMAMAEDRQGNLWLGSEDDGVFLFDPLQNTFSRFAHSDRNSASLGNNMIKSLLVDRKGRLWVGSINGGLNLFDPSGNQFFHYQNEPGNGSSLSQRTISALWEDHQGNLWIGTHRGGVNVYSPGTEKFNLYRQESSPASLSYNDVRAFCEDNGGNIWVGTDGGGLDLFLRDKHIFQHYRYDPFRASSLGSDAVLDVMQDREGRIWVSTWGGGLNLLNKSTGSFTRFQNDPRDSNSISSNFVQKTFEGYEGRLWVATYYGGLNLLDPKSGQFTRFIKDPSGKTSLTGKNIVSIHEDKEGHIWIGTDDGGLNCYHEATRHFTHYFNNGEKMPDLRVLFSDSKGRLWVGQKGLYLFDTARNNFRLYTVKAGLSNEFIKGIAEDGPGNLWISTSNGLTQFNPETEAFKKFNTGDGLQGLEFEANACMKSKDGEIFFGGINGFNSFYPGNIKANPFVPPVYITGFQLFNQKVNPGEEGSPLVDDISLTKEIRLSYKQSTISFNFAALNYTTPENNEYAYKLEKLDKDWNFVGKERKSSYNNLAPGEYTFRVKASNNDGVWNEEGASVKVIITPPFWKTSWFDLLLLAVAVAGLYALYKFKTRLKLKELEERKREEIHQVQLQFFTNISHEFRTPLSLILGPLEKLMKEKFRPSISHYYSTMHRNAQRLLSLINELMDFGKLESGALKLNVMKGNLHSFLSEIAEEFRDWAEQKEIDFTANLGAPPSFLPLNPLPPGPQPVNPLPLSQVPLSPAPLNPGTPDTWFDRQVLEKIVLNLLHNSFKYTKIGGHITLEILPSLSAFTPSFANELILRNDFRGKAYAFIRVADNGIGISRESIRHLFERYYRITDSHLGSGVGLAFVKSLALLHKGDVFVYSERLKGTEIIIGIPVDVSDYKREEQRAAGFAAGEVRLEGLHSKTSTLDAPTRETPPEKTYPGKASPGKALHPEEEQRRLPQPESILLVEDNDELRKFLKESLDPYYNVTESADGREGLAKAKEISPDLIISDVIMPGMNGIDFCRALKGDIDTSHIPFLMLTARSALAAQVEGLDSGADYYFAKPLNMELLLLTIRNRFDQSLKLKDRYTRESHVEAMELVHSEKDKEFMSRLLGVIDSQLVNPDFDIEYLCTEMGMSRTKLYQKIKSISRQSIGDFIRTIRLKKAVQIMTHEDVSLAEVMYRIGIQTQSYFTKAFKKEFNKTPTQFMQEIRKY
jgi:ligand-binding sensor domain-containing protein/signal transduction histidine kinase/DNA-binding response OmpR family regulator